MLELKKSKEQTSRINILNKIQAVNLDVDNDSALFYNKQAEALINQLHADLMCYRCNHPYVKNDDAKFDNLLAVEYCLNAIAVAKQFKDDFQKVNSYRAQQAHEYIILTK